MSDIDVVDWLVKLECAELLIDIAFMLDRINNLMFWNTDFWQRSN